MNLLSGDARSNARTGHRLQLLSSFSSVFASGCEPESTETELTRSRYQFLLIMN